MKLARLLALAALTIEIFLPAYAPVAKADSITPSVIITEIKLGDSAPGTTDNPKEYVAIYNQSNQPVSLNGWTLEYAKSTFNKTYCGDSTWVSHSVSGSASSTPLSGTLQPGQVSLPITRQLTDSTSGSLHLVDASKNIQDLVGWGSSSVCYQTAAAAIPSNGHSLQRNLDCTTANPVSSGDNSKDLSVADTPSPGNLAGISVGCSSSVGGGQTLSCQGVIISEVLPNPSGTDTGHEFIELYNPTSDYIPLTGCGLQVGGSSVYKLGDLELAPQQFKAFYDSETGITLPNSSGGTVYLLSPSLEELSSISYPSNLDDDQCRWRPWQRYELL